MATPVVAAAAGNTGPGGYAADYATNTASFYTNMTGFNASVPPAAHNQVQIWYSTNIQELVAAGSIGPWPQGTVSIKRVDKAPADGVTDEIVVMVKMAAGYDDINGNWYYEVRDATGTTLSTDPAMAAGKNAMCIGCHASTGKDYLAGLDLR